MKSIKEKTSLLLGLLFLSLIAGCSDKTTYAVEKIEDGDTLVVQFKGKSQRIQLSGIDAPENTVNAKLNLDIKVKKIAKKDLLEIGDLATGYLKTQVAVGQRIELVGDLSQADKYGRIPAEVMTEKGESLNEKMIAEGYAVILTRYPLQEAFKAKLDKAQRKAILEKQGLWKTHNKLMMRWSGR